MEIFLYTLSVMYSPGPVNFMGLTARILTGQFKKTIYFFMGVGCAMLMLFMIFGYAGAAIIPQKALHYIALLGACYTFYLAFQMLKADIDINDETTEIQTLSFWNGFWIQTLNPKGILGDFACYNDYVSNSAHYRHSNLLSIVVHFDWCSRRTLSLFVGWYSVRQKN